MMDNQASPNFFDLGIESIELEAEVIRADGTRETLGTVAAFHKDEVLREAARQAGLGEITCA